MTGSLLFALFLSAARLFGLARHPEAAARLPGSITEHCPIDTRCSGSGLLNSVLDPEHRVSDTEHCELDTEHCELDPEHRELDTEHRVFDTEHRVFDTEHSVSNTEHCVSDTEHRVSDTEYCVFDTEHSVIDPKHPESNPQCCGSITEARAGVARIPAAPAGKASSVPPQNRSKNLRVLASPRLCVKLNR
ncbi:MAG: hypothetical protein JSS81_18860 [Acidobacteria bacterium]|nr:hypothetical protein [Acidobacteriota bacterium]